MFRFFFYLILVLLVTSVHGQDYAKKTDSIQSLIAKQEYPEILKSFDALSHYFANFSKQEAIKAATTSLTNASNSNATLAQILANRNLALLYGSYQEYQIGFRYTQNNFSLAKNQDDSLLVGISNFTLAEFYLQQRSLAKALGALLQASSIFASLDNKEFKKRSLILLIDIYFKEKNYSQTVREIENFLQLFDQQSTAASNVITRFDVMNIYNTRGLCFSRLKEYENALLSFDKSYEIASEIKNEFWKGLIQGNKAVVLYDLRRYEEALIALTIDFKTSNKFNNKESAMNAAIKIAEVYMAEENIALASAYLDSAGVIAQQLDKYKLAEYWRILSLLQKANGDYGSAYTALTKYISIYDSLNLARESINMLEVKSNYELAIKQSQIEALAKKEEETQVKIKSQSTLLLATGLIVVLLLVLIAVSIFSIRKLRKTNSIIKRQHSEIQSKNEELEMQGQQLQMANAHASKLNSALEQKVIDRTYELELTLKELDTFLYRSSHDIRRPLSTLLGLENIAKEQTNDAALLGLFDMVGEATRNMDSMLLKLQMAYELAQQEVEFEKVAMADIVMDQVERFRKKIKNGDITLESNTKNSIPLLSNAKLITIIIKNLIENAVNFTKNLPSEKTRIRIKILYLEKELQLIVKDNGIGIQTEYVSRIYEQYFKGTQLSKGNGLGLYLVVKALKKLKGTIQVESTFGIGTTFTITLPYTPY